MANDSKIAYLGDGVYVELGDNIKLYTSNGIVIIHEIYLEPQMVEKLAELVKQEYV